MAQQIEKALDCLRQRYGVSVGLTTEPQIIDIRLGPRVVFNTASLKSYNEDLNTLRCICLCARREIAYECCQSPSRCA